MVHPEVDVQDAIGGGEVLLHRAVVEELMAAGDEPDADVLVIRRVAPDGVFAVVGVVGHSEK